jgi:hypothetical protein
MDRHGGQMCTNPALLVGPDVPAPGPPARPTTPREGTHDNESNWTTRDWTRHQDRRRRRQIESPDLRAAGDAQRTVGGKACGMVHTARRKKAFVVPRELSISEIRSLVSDFAASDRRARAAGADYPTFVIAPTVINVIVTGRNRFIVRAVSWFEVQKRRKDTR